MATPKRNVHVVPNKANGTLDWSVKRQGAQRNSGNFANKSDAMTAACQIAINNRLELFEHGKNGQIQNRNSYGNDPRKIQG